MDGGADRNVRLARATFRRFVLAAPLVLAACAVEAPPPGGEPDREPPLLSETVPADSALGVPRASVIRFSWNEPMEHRSVERSLFFAPPIRWSGMDWEKSSLTMVPADSMTPGRTYVAVLGRNARDRRGNAIGKATVLAFTTGDSLPSGEVDGRVEPLAAGDAARVFAVRTSGAADDVPSLHEADLLSAAETDSSASFSIRFLPRDAVIRTVAYVDRDASGSFTPEAGDPWGFSAAPVALGQGNRHDIRVVMMNPDREGLLRGAVSGTAGSLRALVIASPLGDSLKPVVGVPDSSGGQFVVAVPAGNYRIGVFRDIDGNGHYDSVRVAVADTTAVRDTTTVRDTTVIRDTTTARDASAAGDTTQTPPAGPPEPREPLPPDVVEWGVGEVRIGPGDVSPYVELIAPPAGTPPDSSAIGPK